MSNFKKIIAKILIFSFSLLLCFCCIFFSLVMMNDIWKVYYWWSLGELCMVGVWWPAMGIAGISGAIGLIGIIISLTPKKQPPKILFYSAFFFFVIIIISLSPIDTLLPFSSCDFRAPNQKSFNSYNIETNNEEESKITWKKYTNPLYGFSFEYPDHLKITEDKENNDPFIQKGYWRIQIESTDYKEQAVSEKSPVTGIDVISGFALSIYANPSTSNITFEELMEYKQLGHGGSQIIKKETRENNSRKFFIQTTQETFNDIHWSVSALYNPNLIIGMGLWGTKENKEKMETILNHFIETLE